ncbi:uncharacterized protein LOC100883467 isoform X2 [Megachile rotundata]|uniref:uncharacterized protein LOC100883467 isoform X2 n=1 Tax=Megachile rotundata TaxID=143995 RepID=UPI0006151E2C|nr:PREDICTED: uncharacterized protein LOC100883467 isoform X2 [Megachile rotundata]
MRITYVLFGLTVLVAYAASGPVVKREAESEDLNPLNEVYLVELEDDQAADDDRSNRDKRKIGVVKLGVSNGIINFVFGKLDSFLDSKTKALSALDEANKVKNAAYGIDAKHSATSKFISELVAAKIKAASGSIGPVINSATTFINGAKTGFAGALVSKLAPLSSIAGGLSAGAAAKHEHHPHEGGADHGGLGSTAAILGNILSSKLGSLSSLSQNHGSGHHDSPSHESGSFGSIGGGYEYDPPHTERAYYAA